MTAVDFHHAASAAGLPRVEPVTSSALIARRFEDYLAGEPVPFRLGATLTVYEGLAVYRFDSARPVRLVADRPGFGRSIDLENVRAGNVTLAEAITVPALELARLAFKAWHGSPKVWEVSLAFVFGEAHR